MQNRDGQSLQDIKFFFGGNCNETQDCNIAILLLNLISIMYTSMPQAVRSLGEEKQPVIVMTNRSKS